MIKKNGDAFMGLLSFRNLCNSLIAAKQFHEKAFWICYNSILIKFNVVIPYGTGICHISIDTKNPDVIQFRQFYV